MKIYRRRHNLYILFILFRDVKKMVSKNEKISSETKIPPRIDDTEEFEGDDFLGEFEGELDALSIDD